MKKMAANQKEIKQDVPEPLKPAINELERLIAEKLHAIEERLHSPKDIAANAASQLTTKEQLKELFKSYSKEQLKVAWSTLKATGAGALALIPVLGEAEGGALATAELADAAILEGATKAEASALSKGAVVAGETVVYPLTKILGEEGAKRLNKVLKTIDPFEDVPAIVTLVSGGAEAVGAHGAAAIPAGVQLLINEYKTIRNNATAIKDAGSIILKSPELQQVKDFGASVLGSVRGKIEAASTPRMAQARAAFA